jgi:hypothetical protein
MNLYLLSQYEERGYDSFDSCVVAALNEDDARMINPNNYGDHDPWTKSSRCWCNSPDDVVVELVGVADKSIDTARIILSSFNAG